MTYEKFKKIIEILQDISDRTHNLYQMNVNLMDYDENYHTVISLMMDSVFTEEGVDWIDWYLYERKSFDRTFLKAYDKEGNQICHNIESLWETVKEYVTTKI